MHKYILPLLLFSIFLFSSCGYNPGGAGKSATAADSSNAIPKSEATEMDWQKLYSESEQETITFYQDKLQEIDQSKYEELTNVQFINLLLSDTEEGVVRIVLPAAAEKMNLESGAQIVIVQEEKIPDDSIAGEIRFFKLRNENNHWDLAEVSAVWKCYSGRGHTDYSTEPCR